VNICAALNGFVLFLKRAGATQALADVEDDPFCDFL
jgi:hypothetical protein